MSTKNNKKNRLINEIQDIEKQRFKVKKPKPKKIKTFDDYFLECIKKQKYCKRHTSFSQKGS